MAAEQSMAGPRRLPAGRKSELAGYIADVGQATVAELAEHFGVSLDTIRRDLDRLDADGLVQRTHGGAVAASGQARPDTALEVRFGIHAESKDRIGRAAADLVSSNDAVMVGSGTTVLAAVRHFGSGKNLVVVTNSLLVPGVLGSDVTQSVFVLGGAVRLESQSVVSALGVAGGFGAGRGIRCDLALIGAGGLSSDAGVTTNQASEAEMAFLATQISRRVALLADSSKFDQVNFAQICELNAIDYLVTDREPPAALAAALERGSVEVIVC